MSDTVIKVENLSKQYRLGTVGTGTLSHDLNRLWAKFRGKEDPYLKIGDVNDRTRKSNDEYVWALKDVNFEVRRGEILGIIGRNGAGKSTLLKILSQITKPSYGRAAMKGRIGSLLEVGTGFHQDLTGRENIYINGAILGMRKWEIDKKLDEIIDFAGIEKYVDTPVKRYSSGMMVRLGFAVAAHLEPEILIVDEVLAVGDVEFQKKCMGKMGEVSRNDGRTILFVSHNMSAVQALCNRILLLDQGQLKFDEETETGISKYLEYTGINKVRESFEDYRRGDKLSKLIEIQDLSFVEKKVSFEGSEDLKFNIGLKSKIEIDNFRIVFSLHDTTSGIVGTYFSNESLQIGFGESKNLTVSLNHVQLSPGRYFFNIGVGHQDDNNKWHEYDNISEYLNFEVSPVLNDSGLVVKWWPGWGNIRFRHVSIQEN